MADKNKTISAYTACVADENRNSARALAEGDVLTFKKETVPTPQKGSAGVPDWSGLVSEEQYVISPKQLFRRDSFTNPSDALKGAKTDKARAEVIGTMIADGDLRLKIASVVVGGRNKQSFMTFTIL